MRKLKSILGIIFILICMIGGVPAFADNGGKIIINNNTKTTGTSMKNHTYSIYKVFDLSISKDGQNKSYTVDENFEKFFKEKNSRNEELQSFAKKYMEDNKVKVADELMDYIKKEKVTETKTSSIDDVVVAGESEKITINVEELGHYLIIDNGEQGSDTPSSAIALASMGSTTTDLTINLKAQGPTIDKDIYHNEEDAWKKVGDNEIGDKVEYRVITTVPDINGYESYKYVIHDKMTKGLTFNNDVEIYVGDKSDKNKVEGNYTVNVINSDTETFKIDIDIMKVIETMKLNKGDNLYIYYSATLNENAVTADKSNDNTVYLEYSNNPYKEDDTAETPKITVKDYTFKFDVLKTKEDGKTGLAGAEFQLKKDRQALFFKKDGNKYILCGNHDKSHEGCIQTIVSEEDGKFNIVGLDDKVKYVLEETKAPDGYNKIDPIEFIITVEYDGTGNIVSMVTTNSELITITNNELGTTVINTTDTLLPETGGIGTTIFSVVGILLMGSVGAVLIKRKRKS